jgi:hypothetical protein
MRIAATMLLGVLLLQAAWSLVVPPFRGLDEHDHSYKAAAVAGGDWAADHRPSEQGWGEFIIVPRDIVLAANPVCEALPYTTAHNCSAVEQLGGGLVVVASSAARYNPLFYGVVGTAARWLEGTTALYAMRLAAALICASLMAAAGRVTIRTSQSPWPATALVLATTPMMLYTTMVAAPNGVEVASAMLVWSAVLGIVRLGVDHARTSSLLVFATVGMVPLTLVRGLGPLWLFLIIVTTTALMGRATVMALARRRDAQMCASLAVLSTACGVGWTMAAKAVAAEGDRLFTESPWTVVPQQWLLWFFQSVAAFPARDEMAPAPLYAIVFVAAWILVAVAWRVGSPRHRTALVGVLVMGSAIPVAATVATYETIGTAWQGRYAYPFTMGFLLICGTVVDRAAVAWRRNLGWLVWAAAATMMTANLIGQLTVLRDQLENSPLAGTDAWWAPHPALVVALNVAGFALLATALTRGRREPAATLRA